MDDVVSKPFRIAELIPKIEELAMKFPVNEFPRANELSLRVPTGPSEVPYAV